jgi:hypothetical protein
MGLSDASVGDSNLLLVASLVLMGGARAKREDAVVAATPAGSRRGSGPRSLAVGRAGVLAMQRAAGNRAVAQALASEVLVLQRAAGNRAVAQALASGPPPHRGLSRCAGGCTCGGACKRHAELPADDVERAARAPQLRSVRRLQRVVGRLDCGAGVASAPADPRGALEGIDVRAHEIAVSMATSYAEDAATVTNEAGMPASPSATLQAYIDHFGQPPAQGAGFLNRLTGQVRHDLATAASEELKILSRRFHLIASLLSQPLRYTCAPGGQAINVGSQCSTGDCATAGGDAFSCGGGSRIALCDAFWTNFDDEARAAIILHETFHMIWSSPGSLGSIDDNNNLRGAGRNFDIAGCYEFLVNDVFGMDSHASCPPIP